MTEREDPLAPFRGLQIMWKDGLPRDRSEDSTIEATLVSAKLSSRYSSIKRLNDGDDGATQKEMERIEEEQLEDALGAAATAQGKTPPTRDLDTSKLLLEHLRGGQGGGTRTPEEGGPKP